MDESPLLQDYGAVREIQYKLNYFGGLEFWIRYGLFESP